MDDATLTFLYGVSAGWVACGLFGVVLRTIFGDDD